MINNDIHDNQNELLELKALLFEEEIEAFNALEKKLQTLQLELNDSEQIIHKITPLFDQVLLKKFEDKDERTLEIYAKYLAQIINKSAKNNLPELSKSLQSVISPAISKEIAENKDTMIDALYPIMGGMISKYVTQAIKEMMETINNKIEDGLSFDKYKRKMKSKVTGVSETELLMEESSDATISSMFVIHKESGLLIAEAHLEDKEIDDAHMVASMASAIKDFINEWIKNNSIQSEVQLLSYGNATLYIESAGSVYIIAFLDAEPNYEQRKEINTFFASVIKDYASFFQKFDGDDSADEIVSLSKKMEEYLYTHSHTKAQQQSKIDPVKYILYFLAFVLIGYSLYQFNDWYRKSSLERTVYQETGEEISIGSEDEYLVLNGQVASTDIIYEIESTIKKHTKEKIKNNLLVPMTYLDKRFNNESQTVKKSLSKVEVLEKKFTNSLDDLQTKVLTLTKALAASKEDLEQLRKSTTDQIQVLKEKKEQLKKVVGIKDTISSQLDTIFSNNQFYNREDHTLDFRKLELFRAGNSVSELEAMKIVTETFNQYIKVISKYKEYIEYIIIEGHTDSSGMEADNIVLSKNRALAIKEYLERHSHIKQYNMDSILKVEAYGSSKAIYMNDVEDKDSSRRIKIKFMLKESQILDNVRRVIND